MATPERPLGYRSFVHGVARTVALPHAYTLLIWCTTMVAAHELGFPDIYSVFCMIAGACVAYIIVGYVGRWRNGQLQPRKPVERPYLAAMGNIVLLAVATAVCALAALIPLVRLAWFVVGVSGTTLYLLGIALQAYFVNRHDMSRLDVLHRLYLGRRRSVTAQTQAPSSGQGRAVSTQPDHAARSMSRRASTSRAASGPQVNAPEELGVQRDEHGRG